MNKDNMVYAYNRITSTLKREENSYNTTGMSLGEHMLSDLSQSQDCGSQHKRYTCKQKVKLTDTETQTIHIKWVSW